MFRSRSIDIVMATDVLAKETNIFYERLMELSVSNPLTSAIKIYFNFLLHERKKIVPHILYGPSFPIQSPPPIFSFRFAPAPPYSPPLLSIVCCVQRNLSLIRICCICAVSVVNIYVMVLWPNCERSTPRIRLS